MIRKKLSLTEQADQRIKELKEKYHISYSGAVNMAILKTQIEE